MATTDEVFTAMAARAKETGADNFMVRVKRRAMGGPMGAASNDQIVVTVTDVPMSQITMPESWLETLCGGSGMRDDSTFILEIWHDTKRDIPVGTIPIKIRSQERMITRADIDNVLEDPNYTGPRNVAHPAVLRKVAPARSLNFNGAGSSVLAVPPGNGAVATGYQGVEQPLQRPLMPPASTDADRDYVVLRERQFAEKQRLADVQAERNAADLRERVLKQEIENTRADTARAIADMKQLLQQRDSAPPQKPLVEQLAPLLAALSPFVATLMTSAAESRKAQEEVRRDLARQQAEGQAKVIEMMMKLGETRSAGAEAQERMMRVMSEQQASLMQQNMNLVMAAREAMLEPDDGMPTWIKGLQALDISGIAKALLAPSPINVQPGPTQGQQRPQQQQQALAQAPQPAPAQPQPPVTIPTRYPDFGRTQFDVIEAMIRQGTRPPDFIAQRIADAVGNPTEPTARELAQAQNDLSVIFAARLADAADAPPAVQQYLQAILEALRPKLVAYQQAREQAAQAQPVRTAAPVPVSVPVPQAQTNVGAENLDDGLAVAGDDEDDDNSGDPE